MMHVPSTPIMYYSCLLRAISHDTVLHDTAGMRYTTELRPTMWITATCLRTAACVVVAYSIIQNGDWLLAM